ncbi:MAG: response regulator [Desulfobacterales bacterium]
MENVTKIMVVDDEVGICRNVEKILSKNNFEVIKAQSAQDALEKMAKESFSLLISDIVMPGMNGLELLKLVKKEWPLTKMVMMTAYASTDTAMKSIRLGALDYIPKPFTPDELRKIVDKALAGEMVELFIPERERETIDAIDVDMPFDREEVAKYTGDDYVNRITRSDIPEVEIAEAETLENYCRVGDMVCDIYRKLGATCKAGVKNDSCPQKKAKKSQKSKKVKTFDAKKLIGIDQPFEYNEVVSITGPEYVAYMDRDGFAFLPYEELKKSATVKADVVMKEVMGDSNLFTESAYKNILVIDDEVSVNNNIRKILMKKGYHVDQAATKDEALEKISRHSYKLILLDLRIPGVKGLELLSTISEKHPKTKVIIITGYASIETAVEAARIGAIDYLAKPFTPDEIRGVTEKAFKLAA